MNAIVLLLALGLAGMFGVAAVTKLTDRTGTRTALSAFGAPNALVGPLSFALPLVELAVAAALVPPATRFAGTIGALGLLALFTGAIAVNLARGRTPDCHCFGQLHAKPAGWRTLVRNALLAIATVGLLIGVRADAGPSPFAWIADRSWVERGAFAAALVAALALAALVATIVGLVRAYGRVLLRLEATERALRDVGIELTGDSDRTVSELGLDPGTAAPDFSATLTTGVQTTRDELLAIGLPLLLVFTSPSCGPCRALMPTVARWQRELADRLTIVVASAGGSAEILAEESAHGLRAGLLDSELELSNAFLANGTPSAVLVATDGAVASYVAAGVEEIEALVAGVTDGNEDGPAIGSPIPELELRDVSGQLVPIVDPAGGDTVLLFWNPGCGYCQSMLPDIAAWEAAGEPGRPRLLVVSSGTPDETAADLFRAEMALDPEFAAGRAFDANGTPMAVVIGANGQVASPLLVGSEAVLERLRVVQAVSNTASYE